MAYSIIRSDGNLLTTIADNIIDTTSSSLSLPGRNYNGYGQPVDTNWIRMIEHFAGATVPNNPIRGQMWYNLTDPTKPQLMICPQDGETNPLSWLKVAITDPSGNLVIDPGNINVPNGNVSANSFLASDLLQGNRAIIFGTQESTATTNGALIVAGGVGIAKSVNIGGNLRVEGDITYINVTDLQVEDPIIQLGGGPNGTPLTANDGKDRGTQLQYYTAAPVSAFMGWDNSAGEFILGSDVTNSFDVITVNQYGNLRMRTLNLTGNFTTAGNIVTTSTAAATSTTTGALQVAGGAGIVGNAYIGGNANVTGSVNTAAQLISTVATGTAPLQVTSTTRVNNLFVQGANEANIQLTTTGNYYLNFTSATTGNQVLNSNVAFIANADTGTLYATSFSGNVAAPGANTQIMYNDTGVMNGNPGFTFNEITANVTTTGSYVSSVATGTPPLGVTSTTRVNNLYVQGANEANIQLVSAGTYYLNFTGATSGNQVLNANAAFSADAATGELSAGIVKTTTLTTGAAATPGTIIGAWTLGVGSTLNAVYADLAERFEADREYEYGTVVEMGGEKEITAASTELSENILGVISTSAGYLMNSGAGNNVTHPPIAMAGRVPVRVVGKIRKGDRLVSVGEPQGHARAATKGEATSFNTIGRSLENKDTDGIGMVLAAVSAKL